MDRQTNFLCLLVCLFVCPFSLKVMWTVILLVSVLSYCWAENVPLALLSDPKARCMDGTQSGYYFQSKTII
jgi:hypothetical protein